jgi:cytochrome c
MVKWIIIVMTVAATMTVARAQDIANGQDVFNKICTVCHAVGEGAQTKLGPVLNGLDGRRSGSVEGYNYSDAIKNAGIVWSEATFKEFMPNPAAKVPGTRMVVSSRRRRIFPVYGLISNNSDLTEKRSEVREIEFKGLGGDLTATDGGQYDETSDVCSCSRTDNFGGQFWLVSS